MQVNIEMNNLEQLIAGAMNENIKEVVKEQVDKTVSEKVDKIIKNEIEMVVGECISDYVKDYISNTTIKIGGGYWDDEPEEKLTVEQFIKRQLKECMDSKSMKLRKKNGYGEFTNNYESVTFEDYIGRTFDVSSMIQKDLDKFIEDTKKDINAKIKDSFTTTTKSMLAESVFNVLMNNDTYQKIQNNVACIADRKN